MISTRNNDPMMLLFRSMRPARKARDDHAHLENLSNLLRYLVRLRRDGTLDDNDFAELVKLSAAAFIESEVAGRVDAALDTARIERQLELWK